MTKARDEAGYGGGGDTHVLHAVVIAPVITRRREDERAMAGSKCFEPICFTK